MLDIIFSKRVICLNWYRQFMMKIFIFLFISLFLSSGYAVEPEIDLDLGEVEVTESG